MHSLDTAFAPVRISTADIPERDRVAVWREVIGRKIVRVDIEPLEKRPFFVDASIQSLPDLGFMAAAMSEFRLARPAELVGDGNSDLRLVVNISGSEVVSQAGREVTLGPGDAVLVSMAETGGIVRPAPGRRVGFNIPRHVLTPLVGDVETARMRLIPSRCPALRQLMSYVGILQNDHALATPELRQLAATHIHDLLALVIGATKDAEAAARGRGARAAQLRAILADISENLTDRGLSIDVVAQRHRIGTRNIQRLFAAEGTTFSEIVTGQRLARARRMLRESRLSDRSIADIAEACGFSDPAYFGRRFRQMFGLAPSDVRAGDGNSDEI